MAVFEVTIPLSDGQMITRMVRASRMDEVGDRLGGVGFTCATTRDSAETTLAEFAEEIRADDIGECQKELISLYDELQQYKSAENQAGEDAYQRIQERFNQTRHRSEGLPFVPLSLSNALKVLSDISEQCPDLAAFRDWCREQERVAEASAKRLLDGDPEAVEQGTILNLGKGAILGHPGAMPTTGELRLMNCMGPSLVFLCGGPVRWQVQKLADAKEIASTTVKGFLKKRLEIVTPSGYGWVIDFGWFGLGMKSRDMQIALRILDFERSR